MRVLLICLLVCISSFSSCEGNKKGYGGAQLARLRSGPPLRVAAVLSDPYVMQKESNDDELEGFCIDLMDLISTEIGINYTIDLVDYNQYGGFDSETKEWNGMIGKLVNNQADAAIGDLTENRKRAKVVDFTIPWMNFGVGVLFTKPVDSFAGVFTFLTPFDWSVWLLIAVCYLVMGLVIFALAKVTGQNTSQNGHKITLFRSLFFRQVPMRGFAQMVAVAVWFIFLVFVACIYITNLSRMLNVKQSQEVTSLDDLVRQENVQFGCLRTGSTCHFLRKSKYSTLYSVYKNINTHPDKGYTTSNSAGVESVKAYPREYAFLMESSSIDYILQRECDLMQVGGILNSASYAIGLRKGSPYLDDFNDALLKLREDGILQELIIKWWKQERGGGQCEKYEAEAGTGTIHLDFMGGIFILLLIGVVLAFIAAAVEKVLTRKQQKNYAPQAKSELDRLQERA